MNYEMLVFLFYALEYSPLKCTFFLCERPSKPAFTSGEMTTDRAGKVNSSDSGFSNFHFLLL